MRYDTVPEWRTGIAVDFETTAEVTLTLAPHIAWDAVENRDDVLDLVKSIVLAFSLKYADVDWRETDLDYALTLDRYTLDYIAIYTAAMGRPDWLRDF